MIIGCVVQIEPKYGQLIAFEASPAVILQRKLLIYLLATRRSMNGGITVPSLTAAGKELIFPNVAFVLHFCMMPLIGRQASLVLLRHSWSGKFGAGTSIIHSGYEAYVGSRGTVAHAFCTGGVGTNLAVKRGRVKVSVTRLD